MGTLLFTFVKIISAVITAVEASDLLKQGAKYVFLNRNMIISNLQSDHTLLAMAPGFIV